MSLPAVSYKRHRFPPQIIAHAVWVYFRFPLSLRLVEEMDYMDQALMPAGDDGDETLDLFTKTTGGDAAVTHFKKVAGLTSGIKAA